MQIITFGDFQRIKPDQAKDVDGNEGDHIDNLDKNREKILLKLTDFFSHLGNWVKYLD